MVNKFSLIKEIEKKSMLIGVLITPTCWKNPMDIINLMEVENEN